MENDLLTEDDFTVPVKYNVLKKFRLFYVGALVHLIIFYFVTDNFADGSRLSNALIIANMAIPLIIAAVMIFGNKENSYMPLKKITLAIGYLCITYYIGLNLVNTIDYLRHNLDIRTLYEPLYIGLAIFGCYFIVCCAFILPIARVTQKRRAKL